MFFAAQHLAGQCQVGFGSNRTLVVIHGGSPETRSLGQPDVQVAQIQVQWSELMDQLRGVLALTDALDTVQQVTTNLAR